MAGIPQLREVGRLYAPSGELLALIRLEQRMDGSGIWDVLVNDPVRNPTQRGEFASEQAARVELERLYALGRLDGEWRIRVPDNPYERPTHSETPTEEP